MQFLTKWNGFSTLDYSRLTFTLALSSSTGVHPNSSFTAPPVHTTPTLAASLLPVASVFPPHWTTHTITEPSTPPSTRIRFS